MLKCATSCLFPSHPWLPDLLRMLSQWPAGFHCLCGGFLVLHHGPTLWFLPYSVGLFFSFLGSLPSPVSLFLCCLLKAEKTKHMDFQHMPPVPCLFFFLCTCEPALSEEDLCGRVSCALWAASCGLGLLYYVHTKPACSPFLPFPVLREFLSKQQLPITCQS